MGLNLLLGAFALRTIGEMSDTLKITIERTAKKLEINGEIGQEIEGARTAQRGEVLFGLMKNQGQVAQNRERFNSQVETLGKHISELSSLVDTAAGKNAVEQLRRHLATWQSHHQEMIAFTGQGKFEDAGKVLIEKTMPDAEAMQRSSDEVLTTLKGLMAASQAEAESSSAQSKWVAISFLMIAITIGFLVIVVVRNISGKLKDVSSAMDAGASEVAAAAGQVATSSQSLAQGSSEQAASLEETSASGEEITSMTRQNADNSRTAADCMAEVDARVVETNRTLHEMESSMAEINSSSDKIARIIKVIDEIAFQTNIRALNAAVEAARAGEAGMGFAVVADEVRNLAQRSAQAAKDTAGLIEESISNSQEGSAKLSRMAAAIQSITSSAAKVKTLIDEVNLGSQEQARGIEQISKAISQMEQVTQRNAANAEESASAAQEMTAQADRMKSFVVELQSMVGASKGMRSQPERHVAATSPRHRIGSKGPGGPGEMKTNTGQGSRAMERSKAARHTSPSAAARPAATLTANDFPMDEEFTEF